MSSAEPTGPTRRGRPRGRRPAGTDTRGLILDAARSEFAEKGYAAASLRAIARRAGVDPALVHHYFDGKDELFTSTLDAPANPAALIAGLLRECGGTADGLGLRLVSTFLGVWDAPAAQERLRAMLRGALEHEVALQGLREYLVTDVLGQVAALLPPDEAQRRLGLVASQLIGLALARFVVGMPGVADADRDELAAAVAPTIQRYLTGELTGELT